MQISAAMGNSKRMPSSMPFARMPHASYLMLLKKILRRRKLVFPCLVLTLLAAYVILDNTGALLHASPAYTGKTLDNKWTLEDTCEEFFSSLVSQRNDWSTDFTTDNRQEIISTVQRMRLYSHCYLRNNFVPRSFNLNEVERRLFHVFVERPRSDEDDNRETVSMWSMYGKGKGIALSLGTNQLPDFRRLVAVLGVLGNELPIEVIYKGDLKPSDIQTAITAGKEAATPQKIQFIDVENRIVGEHFAKFSRFANKWLAALFNSFEEMILLDADVVPYVNPADLFEMEAYKNTSSYMFRDRAVSSEFLSVGAKTLYHKLLPTEEETEEFQLPKPQLGRKRLALLSDRMHLVESGFVLLNRRKFLPGLLIGFAMQLWRPTSSPVWGDKELFWIGQSVAGEEDYSVSPRYAGTVGIIKDLDGEPADVEDSKTNIIVNGLHKAINGLDRKPSMVCSTHPAHFNENNELLWINSGLKQCKLGTWMVDYDKYPSIRKRFQSKEELRDYYNNAIEINGAIIPPMVSNSFADSWRNLEVGFQKRNEYGCSGYIWCAYDNPAAGYPGTKILFNSSQLQTISMISKAWIEAN